MAANYWDSTQYKYWTFTKDELSTMRQQLEDEDPALVQAFPLPRLRHLGIFFNQQVNRLGKRLNLRQQALATAQVYIRRFYTKIEIRRTNPYLVVVTAVYLACKMEETPHHIRMVVQEARSLWPHDFNGLLADSGRIGECEFMLISELRSQLIIHQPYSQLTRMHQKAILAADELALAWGIVNDSFMTDLPLLYPPHVIALTAALIPVAATYIVGQANKTNTSNGSNTISSNNGAASCAVSPASSTPASAGSMNIATAMAQFRAMAAAGGVPSPSVPGMPQASGGEGNGSDQQPQQQQQQQQQQPQPKKAPQNRMSRFMWWIAESKVDIEAMVDCAQEMVCFYEFQEQYDDKTARDQISRFIKARGLDK